MGRMLGLEEELSSARLFGCDRVILGVAAALCFALWATSTNVLVASSRYDGGRSVACKYFTGTHLVERHFSLAASGADGQGCPVVRMG